ncbi:hypothetical protein HPB52_002977 [Rhipicephalus sanguineus]|uniref:Uncharacterized protein n=1 Tax=Rhipicephalus sanguineus TaxID=34632 RepID=A0A9D4Q9H3_RHISA|nr:hypothetical protein HPB52_002977 [Rhipicephalus sanguineus]
MAKDEPEVEVDPRATKATGPAPKRRAIEGIKERKITERIEKQGDRLDHLEATSKVTNERLTALEQTRHRDSRATVRMTARREKGHVQGQGVCTFVRKGITFMEHELIGRSAIEHCTVEVITGKKRKESTFLVNVYSNASHGQQKFKALLHKASRIEAHCKVLCTQQWNEVCNEADGQMHKGKTWNMLRHLLDETKTKGHQHNNLARILHRAICENGEDEVKQRLDAKYLPTTSTERHPDYQGNENETLDRDIETRELCHPIKVYSGLGPTSLLRMAQTL